MKLPRLLGKLAVGAILVTAAEARRRHAGVPCPADLRWQ